MNILSFIIAHKNITLKAILGLAVGSLIASCVYLRKANERLSESLEIANNNIEAYEGIINKTEEQNSQLILTNEQLEQSNDSLLCKLKEVIKENDIKLKNITSASTQTQVIYVTKEKEVEHEEPLSVILEKYKTYSDSISYNDLTKVHYTIGEDTISIDLDIQNTQYLYTYKTKEWKNKKKFLKRLFTLDFKKVYKYRYEIVNTNDLINTSDVRIIEVIE